MSCGHIFIYLYLCIVEHHDDVVGEKYFSNRVTHNFPLNCPVSLLTSHLNLLSKKIHTTCNTKLTTTYIHCATFLTSYTTHWTT